VNAATGATTERSWSFASYAVPADGYVHLLVKFKDATSVEDYPAIIKDAFKLKTLAAFLNLSMAAKDEKTIKLPVKNEMFYPKEGIAHRGFSSVAPENTLPAYRLAAQNGFKWVECDVQYTSDGVAVLCHDSTINRTSSGTGTLSSYTLAQLREFDFGSWKSADYAGTPIPTLEDFLMCCNRLGLNAVIDFSNTGTPSTVKLYAMFELIIKCGMSGRVMLLTTGIKRMVADLVSYGCDAIASVSYLSDNITDVASDSMLALKDYKKRGYAVSLSTDYSHITDDVKNFCKENDIPLNAYTVNSESVVTTLADIGCVAFITSDTILAQDYIKTLELEKDCTDL
jgi:glycerophosphoryl diester phosphodiesterase